MCSILSTKSIRCCCCFVRILKQNKNFVVHQSEIHPVKQKQSLYTFESTKFKFLICNSIYSIRYPHLYPQVRRLNTNIPPKDHSDTDDAESNETYDYDDSDEAQDADMKKKVSKSASPYVFSQGKDYEDLLLNEVHRYSSMLGNLFGFSSANPDPRTLRYKPTPDEKKEFFEEQKIMYQNIIDSFPGGLQMAFSFGSAAFKFYKKEDSHANVLDIIFVVDKAHLWHKENMKMNPEHYSFLKGLGPKWVTVLQERYGAGLYFSSMVMVAGRPIRYGVVSTRRLETDLLDWESLYVAGRLHKPIRLLVLPDSQNLVTALSVNLRSAMHASLLLLPDGFTEEMLYTTATALSYTGGLTQHTNMAKIADIVRPNQRLFRKMYSNFLLEEELVAWWPDEGVLEQALDFHSRYHHLKCLPARVLQNLLTRKYERGRYPDMEEVLRRHALDSECGKHVIQSIRLILQENNRSQTAKDILSAGLGNYASYSARHFLDPRKTGKRYKGMKAHLHFWHNSSKPTDKG